MCQMNQSATNSLPACDYCNLRQGNVDVVFLKLFTLQWCFAEGTQCLLKRLSEQRDVRMLLPLQLVHFSMIIDGVTHRL